MLGDRHGRVGEPGEVGARLLPAVHEERGVERLVQIALVGRGATLTVPAGEILDPNLGHGREPTPDAVQVRRVERLGRRAPATLAEVGPLPTPLPRPC